MVWSNVRVKLEAERELRSKTERDTREIGLKRCKILKISESKICVELRRRIGRARTAGCSSAFGPFDSDAVVANEYEGTSQLSKSVHGRLNDVHYG